MGNNGWYISPVVVIFDFHGNRTYYKIDSGAWQEYTVPFVVSLDGEHTVLGYYVDDEGNVSPTYTISFKIDQTPPVGTLIVNRVGFFRWQIIFNVSDATSGVGKVEFYVDDVIMGEVTTAPWEYIYQGTGRIAQAIAYDMAGNLKISQPATPYIPQYVNQIFLNNQQKSLHLFFNGLKITTRLASLNAIYLGFTAEVYRYS